ncbi:MAG TPA: sigma-70 family RNA polymerase sigma factor [Thermoleophilaceae bacterium]|nr:sigma-70 family RNA polymerase sigma factor [Thermoleophilaceae bacterium]
MTPRALFHPARLARRPVLSTQSDERLVDLVRAGSDPAFEAIVERYRRALMRYVSRLLPPERAEDVVQQSFVKAYEAMHRNSAELNLKPWLYRIAHNGALNALRDRSAAHAELSDTIDGVERPDQAFERSVGLRELVVAVQALPERQRSAILLREMEGRSYEEIATALGVTDGAVRQLLNRARNTLRAAAASVIPMPLVERVASSESTDPVTARVAELVGLGGGALAMKVCATALVTGAVVGGAAVVPDIGREQASRAAGAGTARAAEPSGGESDAASEDTSEAGEHGAGRRGEDGGGSGEGDRREGGGERGDRGDGDDGPRDRGGDRGTGEDGGHGGSQPGDDDRTGRRGGDEEDDHSGPGGGGGDGGAATTAPTSRARTTTAAPAAAKATTRSTSPRRRRSRPASSAEATQAPAAETPAPEAAAAAGAAAATSPTPDPQGDKGV